MSQPESAERCAICGCATGDEIPPSKRCPASFIAYADETGCWKLGFERVSRALAEAEKDRDHWRGTAIRTAEDLARSADRLAEAEKELAVWRNEDAREAKYEWVSKQATAAEERAAQAERVRMLVEKWAAQPCIQRNIRLSGKMVHPDCPNTPRRKGPFCLSCQARKALSWESATHTPQAGAQGEEK